MRTLATLLTVAVLSGCAADTNQIRASYVSSYEYESYTCERLRGEAERVTRLAQEVGARVDDAAETDDVQMAAGMILFWPALFFLEGEETADTQEYAELKGRMTAIEEASLRKDCKILFRSL